MSISTGDTVRWKTEQGTTTGTEPFWIVESRQTGSRAAHKESTLEKG